MGATIRDKIKYFCQQKCMTEEQLANKINNAFERPSGEELSLRMIEDLRKAMEEQQ